MKPLHISATIGAAVITAAGGIAVAVITTRGGASSPSVSSPAAASHVSSAATTGTPAVTPSVIAIPSIPSQQHAAQVFLNRDSGPTGTQVLVSGQGFGPGERVVITFHTTQVGSTNASDQGGFANVAITIPSYYSAFAPQQFDVLADGSDTLREASAPFTVTG